MESSSPKSIDEVVEEITRIHRSLPKRPGIEEIEVAKTLIRNVELEDQARFDAIVRQTKNLEVPEELFMILLEMQKNLVIFSGKDQRREALRLLDLENFHSMFDELIQRASRCIPSKMGSNSQSTVSNSSGSFSLTNTASFSCSSPVTTLSSSLFYEKETVKASSELFTRDDSYVKKVKSTFYGEEEDESYAYTVSF